MNVIWDSQEPLKPSEIKQKLVKNLAYTTITTVLTRLVDKGMLHRAQKGNVYYYKPSKPRKKFAEDKLPKLFNELLGSYGNLAIAQFVDTLKDNPSELETLKKYLNKKND